MPVLMQGEKLEGQEGGRWEVVKKIGEGQFSEVYLVLELGSQDERALKIEKTSRVRTVKAEYKILQRLQDKCRQSVRVYECGEYPCPGPTSRFFMVMDLLGCNLAHVRRTALPEGQADPQTALVVGSSMLRALEEVHAQGFIHRDVKPANFCAKRGTEGTPSKVTWTLVDFGLAKQYMTDQGVLLDARPEASFRGSSTYASVNCHEGQDQSRRDDLWGWLYCLVELLDGTLPWRAERDAPPGGGTWAGGEVAAQLLPSPPQDGQPGPLQGQQQAGAGTGALRRDEEKEQIRQSKLQCLQQPQLLFSTMPCPQAVVEISAYLQRLGFADKPDYQWLRGRLLKLGDEGEAQAGPPPPQLAAEPATTNGVGCHGEEAVARQAPAERGSAQPQLGPEGAAAAGVSGADGASRDGQPPVQQQKQEEQQQQEGVDAPGLSKQRSRDRDRDRSKSRSRARSRSRGGDRERDGRGWEDGSRDGDRGRAQRGGTRELSSSRGRRSRSRGRRSRSRSREPRRRSRSRSRSRSRQRDGGRERRERPRDRERERDGARASRRSRSPERSRERDLERPARNRRQRFGRQRSQERRGGGARSSEGVQRRGGTRSRSRTPLQQRADRGGRDRDRGGGAGGRQQRRREERASDVPAASPDAAVATGAARDHGSTPAAALLDHLPAPHGIGGAAEPALPPSGDAAAEPLTAAGRAGGTAYSADRHAQYRGLLEYVFALRQGALSEPAAAACRQLRGLEPSEAAGVLCWLLDELATATDPQHLPAVSAFCEELSAFAAGTAKRCLERAQQRGQQQQRPEPQREEWRQQEEGGR